MKCLPIMALAGLPLFGVTFGTAADDAKKIPLASVYATTGQKDTKNPAVELRDEPAPYGDFTGVPAIFLVNGKDCLAAVRASRPFLQLRADGKTPEPKAETRADEQNWVGACIGSNGSSPPAYRVLSVEVDGKKIRITFESITRIESTADEHLYALWAPLGTLSAGEYTLELFDAKTKKVTASRKSKVVEP